MTKFKIVAKVVHSPWDLADSGWDKVRVRDSSGLGQPEVGGPSLQMGAEVHWALEVSRGLIPRGEGLGRQMGTAMAVQIWVVWRSC